MSSERVCFDSLRIMDSIDLIKSKSIRGFSTPLFLKLKKMMVRSILPRHFFSKNKKNRFTALIVMSKSCSANNWRLLKNVQKEKGSHESHDVIGVYSRFTRSPGGAPKIRSWCEDSDPSDDAHLLSSRQSLNLSMLICKCSWAFQPGPAELVTNDVQITLRGSILLNQ